jgi:hypothetical protein
LRRKSKKTRSRITMTSPFLFLADPTVMMVEAFAGIMVLALGARYLRHVDKPRQRLAARRSYSHTYYNIDRAVFINADPSSSRSSFQIGRGAALPVTTICSLPRGEQLMLLEANRPLRTASTAEQREFARMQDRVMRGGH